MHIIIDFLNISVLFPYNLPSLHLVETTLFILKSSRLDFLIMGYEIIKVINSMIQK